MLFPSLYETSFLCVQRLKPYVLPSKVDVGESGTIKSTCFEDNSGCLKMTTAKRITPRTKHISVVYHWFWDQTGDEGTDIALEKIDTTIQKADICTKALERTTFEAIRKILMGW